MTRLVYEVEVAIKSANEEDLCSDHDVYCTLFYCQKMSARLRSYGPHRFLFHFISITPFNIYLRSNLPASRFQNPIYVLRNKY